MIYMMLKSIADVLRHALMEQNNYNILSVALPKCASSSSHEQRITNMGQENENHERFVTKVT